MTSFLDSISTVAIYGGVQPLQTHYGAAKPFWAVAGSGGGGSSTSTINTEFINTSTIVVNQGTNEYGLSILASEGLGGRIQIVGEASASIAMTCGGNQYNVNLDDQGSMYLDTGSAGVLERNRVELEQRDTESGGKTAGVYIQGLNEFSPYVELQHREEIGDDVFPTVTGSVRVGGAQYPSTMNIGLYDGSGNPLAELGFRDTGLATNVMSAQSFTALNTGVGLGSVFYPGFTNSNSPLDILQAIPLARILNSNGGDANASSGINQYGRMTPGSIAQTIPTTSFTDAAKVVLAPRTFIQLYTGSDGSGGSVAYDNQDNSLFSTFTADPNTNVFTFNSYKLFFGN